MLNILFVLIWVMALHFIGDFIFQSEWMARNKSKNINALWWHAFTYVSVLFVGLSPLDLLFHFSFVNYFSLMAFNFVAHFWTDFLTSRVTAKLAAKAAKNDYWHDFFVIVGVDQLIHFLTLTVTVVYLLK